MAAPSQPLAERTDIHKACKSIETLLSVFNDYCEAAGAVVALQKKLAKALRETAGMKVTEEIAGNTLNASASIFEALCEVDTKFAKIADKEYDAISGEVKKWFKKLAKEEKVHDDRIAAANAKIKQAGQIYEKKSKKSARDASDEHARYINLISAMGPEISQEKYNHSLLVTQKHTATTYSVASCVARVADAEWLRSCESVRRYSPTVGKLGEWRALCEGGWTGALPPDLPDIDYTPSAEGDYDATLKTTINTKEGLQPPAEQMNNIGRLELNDSPQPSPLSSPSQAQPREFLQRQIPNETRQSPAPPSSYEPPRKWLDDNNGSVRSLSAFPAPPTHVPLPPAMRQRQQIQQPSQSPSTSSSTSNISFPSPNVRFADSPNSIREKSGMDEVPPSPTKTSVPENKIAEKSEAEEDKAEQQQTTLNPRPPSPVIKRVFPTRSQTIDEAFESAERAVNSLGKPNPATALAKQPDAERQNIGAKDIDRSSSNGSVVAAMRNRYSQNSDGSSPPPRDVPRPRLPLSVNDLASRYDRSTSPRPQGGRSLPSVDSYHQVDAGRGQSSPPVAYRSSVEALPSPSITPTLEEDAAAHRRRQQRIDQLAELELKEKEQALRLREQELQMRATELERERMNLRQSQSPRSQNDSGPSKSLRTYSPVAEEPESPPIKPRERQLSFQQQQLQQPVSPVQPRPRVHSQYSASATHLVPPRMGSRTGGSDDGDYGRPSSSFSSASNHAPYCQCDTCNTSRSVPQDRSPVSSSPVKEKGRGWMRRLSMPIVGGLDKKGTHTSSNSYSGKGGMLSLDTKRNPSSIASSRSPVTEDGRMGMIGRKSYDSSLASNRSMTNLGISGRR
ncbi:hypothetical protein D9758_003755 [Tetrapyrgos nigripes]|uniref:Uncharacterized protein n=1 Tax=Tetrapyrgos nigripes TaxID=182062 RepID=A0A8H5GLX6_9AGAR|nr:hypothetical protein D9758_003755 [Tetrapyrgos nigripes]